MPRFDFNGSGMTSQRTRDRLVARLREKGISNEAVLAAIGLIPRHLFVDEALAHRAYEDTALPIGYGQTISQPFIVALMTQILLAAPRAQVRKRAREGARQAAATQEPAAERLSLHEGGPVAERGAGLGRARVLEVGTGSGYQTAVLASLRPLVRRVFTVERLRDLSLRAEQRLHAMGSRSVRFRHADGYQGWAEEGPFDGILVTAAPPEVPQALLDQLAIGGRLVVPVGGDDVQELKVYDRTENGHRMATLEYVRFVPLLKGRR
ncbi:MAG: protein-L-isoaspartate O-methyltransferase [Pseudomonadales bacterium]